MEEIIVQLFGILESVSFAGALSKDEEELFEKLQKEYAKYNEATYMIVCSNCGKQISF